METETDTELAELLERLSPPIDDLMVRMMNYAALTWDEARAYRDEIVELNRTAKSDEEQAALLFAFEALMDGVEAKELVAPESLEHLRGVRKGDYKFMLIVQAMVGEGVDPDRLEQVTRGEVDAGRIAADDDFRILAVDGATVLGTQFSSPKGRSWLRRVFGRD